MLIPICGISNDRFEFIHTFLGLAIMSAPELRFPSSPVFVLPSHGLGSRKVVSNLWREIRDTHKSLLLNRLMPTPVRLRESALL
jgi:hypothetical protein